MYHLVVESHYLPKNRLMTRHTDIHTSILIIFKRRISEQQCVHATVQDTTRAAEPGVLGRLSFPSSWPGIRLSVSVPRGNAASVLGTIRHWHLLFIKYLFILQQVKHLKTLMFAQTISWHNFLNNTLGSRVEVLLLLVVEMTERC